MRVNHHIFDMCGYSHACVQGLHVITLLANSVLYIDLSQILSAMAISAVTIIVSQQCLLKTLGVMFWGSF